MRTAVLFKRGCLLLASAFVAATGFADETRLLSGFYDPTVENAWTLVLTGTVNGGDPVPDDQPAQDGDYGLISDARGWVCKVKVVSAEKKTLKFGAAKQDLFKEWPATVAERQLDLTGPVTRGAEAWTITQISNSGTDFFQNDSEGNLIKLSLFRAPKTLTGSLSKPFFGSSGVGYQDAMETMILDCPLLVYSGFSNDKFGTTMRSLKRVYFNLPNNTDAFNLNLGASNGKLSETDVSDWVLTKTPTLSNTSTFKANFTGSGVLRFPSVTALADSALAVSMITGLEIGTLKTSAAVTVGASAAAGASLANVVLGGGGCSFAIDTNAFACANLTRVTLNGGVPTWTNEGLVFGTVETPAQSMVFTVELCDAWTAVMMSEAVTPLTAAERAAYATAHPGETVPYGVAAPSVFRTAAEQYVAYPKFISFSLLGDAIGRGTAKVYKNGNEVVPGMYYPDEIFGELTLVATPETADDAFAEWEGFVTRTAVRDNPLVFTYDESKGGLTIVPRFNRTWVYTPGDLVDGIRRGTLSQGDWALNCHESAKTAHGLILGLPDTEASLFATAEGSGLLDLTGKVRTATDEGWTIISPGDAFGYGNKDPAIADAKNLRRIDMLYLPTTLTSIWPRQYFNWAAKGSVMPKFVMDCPNISGTLAKWIFHYFYAKEWVLRVPAVTEIADDLMEYASIGADTDFGKWNLASLTKIGHFAIYGSANAGGVLALPAAVTVKSAAFNNLGADAIEFGRTTDKTVGLGTIEAGAATGAAHLKELSFLSKPAFTADEKAFAGSTALEKVTILGRPIDATSLSNIVSAVSAASDKTCSIYVGYKVRGTSGESWTDLVDPNLTPDEAPFRPADRPDAKFLGVIDNPVRNCWVFGVDSPHNPKGAILLFR